MAAKKSILIAAEAQRDIREAALWIAADDPAAAVKFIKAIDEAIFGLADFPGQLSLSPETKLGLTDEPVSQLLFGKSRTKYRILFTLQKTGFTVIRVLHGARRYLGHKVDPNLRPKGSPNKLRFDGV